MTDNTFTLKPGLLAIPQKQSIMCQVQLNNQDPDILDYRWRDVNITDGARDTGWPRSRTCTGAEVFLLLEESRRYDRYDSSNGWIVLFEEQPWFIWTISIFPLDKQKV